MSKKKAHPEPEPAAPEANASGRNALVLRLPELTELAKLLRAAYAPRVLYCQH